MKSIVGEGGDRKPDKETVCEFFFMVKSKQLRKILDLLENSLFSSQSTTEHLIRVLQVPALLFFPPSHSALRFTIHPI